VAQAEGGGGGGGVEAGPDGAIYQSSGGVGVWNEMTGQCSITPGGVISCDGGNVPVVQGLLVVSPTGSDSNTCTIAAPCATYGHAASVAVTDGASSSALWTVAFTTGAYSENVQLVPWVSLAGWDTGGVTVLNGTVTLGSGFTSASLQAGYMANLTINGAVTLTETGLPAGGGVQFELIAFEGGVTITGGGTTNENGFINCIFGSSVGVTNATFSSQACDVAAAITVTATSDNALLFSTVDYFQSVTVVGSGSGTASASLVGSAVLNGITLTGTHSAYTGTMAAMGTSLTLTGGASASQYSITGSGNASTGQVLAALGSGNIGFSSLAGDCTISGGNVVCTQIQGGEITAGASTGTLTCAAGATACGETQASTTGTSPATMKMKPQVSTNGNGNGSIFDVDLGVSTGSGNEGMFEITRNGVLVGAIGVYSQSLNTLGSLWLGDLTPSATNFTLDNNPGGGLSINTASVGMYFEYSGAPIFFMNSNGIYTEPGYNLSFNTSGSDFGGGGGEILIAPVSTAPTSAPATNDILAFLPVGLASVSPAATSTNLAGYGIAPVWSGTINTQTTLPHQVHGGYASTAAGSTPVVVYTLSLGSAHAVGMNVHCTGRMTANCVSGCSIGDMVKCDASDGWTNVGGTLTEVGSPTNTCQHSGGASMTGITTTASGSTISVKVTNGTSATADWSCYSEEIFD
jgi:hypothetical protein